MKKPLQKRARPQEQLFDPKRRMAPLAPISPIPPMPHISRILTMMLVLLSLIGFASCKRPISTEAPQSLAPSDRNASSPAPSPANSGISASAGVPGTPATPATPGASGTSGVPTTAIDKNAQAVVIGYHRFVQKVKHPDTEITPADFERQMQTLKENGIQVISMQDYLAWRRGEKNIPPRSAIITIDDGYKSIYEVAWPILKKFGYPCTLFIYTDYVKGGPKSGGESLSWQQLAELRDEGADIQSHTISHRDLRGKRHGSQPPDYEAWLWNELNGSKQQLEEKLGIKVNAIAVPYGFCNQHVRETAAKAGYEAIFTVYGQKLNFTTPLDDLGRYIIESNKPKLFATAVDFGSSGPAGIGAPEPIAELTVASLNPQPADGQTIKETKPRIRASLQNLPPIDPGTLQMRISGLGVVPATYSPATKSVAYSPPKDLQKGDYTVILSAKSQGRKTEARWSFKVE